MNSPIDIKYKLLQHCIAMKEESAIQLNAAMDDAQQSANEYGPPKDRYDSFRAQLLRKRDMLAQQFAVAQEELRYLRQLKTDIPCRKVEPGALVNLSSQHLFVSVGLGKIEVEGEIYYAVSPVVPIAIAMKGLKKGDTFIFQGNKKEILDIQ